MIKKIAKPLYWLLLALMVFPFELFRAHGTPLISPPVALFCGLVFAFIFLALIIFMLERPYKEATKLTSDVKVTK